MDSTNGVLAVILIQLATVFRIANSVAVIVNDSCVLYEQAVGVYLFKHSVHLLDNHEVKSTVPQGLPF